MVEIVDCSSWRPYEGNAEGSGRSEKQWLVSTDGQVGLFKFPKCDPVSGRITHEHVPEHLAYRIGDALGVETAKVDLGSYKGRMGSISYLLVGEEEWLYEGLQFIMGRYPNYGSDTLYDPTTGERYSIKHIFEVVEHEEVTTYWIEMLLFDFLIGNSDRHHSNWGFILTPRSGNDEVSFNIRPCPLYDNGSSLCCFVREDQIRDYLGKDGLKFNSLVDTKSLSMPRIDPRVRKHPRHSEVVRYLLCSYPSTRPMAESFLEKLSPECIHSLIDAYQDEVVSPSRKELLIRFLRGKTEILKHLVMESKHV